MVTKWFGKKARVLWICDGAICRSRTGAEVFGGECAGIMPWARIPLTAEHVMRATHVVVMERRQYARLVHAHRDELVGKTVLVMQIPDRYGFKDPMLVKRIEQSMVQVLHGGAAAALDRNRDGYTLKSTADRYQRADGLDSAWMIQVRGPSIMRQWTQKAHEIWLRGTVAPVGIVKRIGQVPDYSDRFQHEQTRSARYASHDEWVEFQGWLETMK